MRKTLCCLMIGSVVGTAAGCGSGDQRATAPVTGTLTYNGQPVTEGQLQFSPQGSQDDAEPGKPGAATIQPDGTFTVSTYAAGDGAVVGPHSIEYVAPPPRPKSGSGDSNPAAHSGTPTVEQERVPSAFAGLVVQQNTVEIESGGNDLELNLVK